MKNLLKIFRQMTDDVHPLVVFEFRRQWRSKMLHVLAVIYCLGLISLTAAYYVTINEDFINAFIFVSCIFAGATGLAEGSIAVEYAKKIEDETFDTIPLTYWEKFCGRMQIGLAWSTLFIILTVPFIIALALVKPKHILLIIPLLLAAWSVCSLKLIAYGFITPYRKRWEQWILVGVAIGFVIVMIIGAIWVDNTGYPPGHTNVFSEAGVAALLLGSFVLVCVWDVVAWFFVRYYLNRHLNRPQTPFSRLFAVNMLVYCCMMLVFVCLCGGINLVF